MHKRLHTCLRKRNKNGIILAFDTKHVLVSLKVQTEIATSVKLTHQTTLPAAVQTFIQRISNILVLKENVKALCFNALREKLSTSPEGQTWEYNATPLKATPTKVVPHAPVVAKVRLVIGVRTLGSLYFLPCNATSIRSLASSWIKPSWAGFLW